MKKYLRIKSSAPAKASGYLVSFKTGFEWVDSADDASAGCQGEAEATQRELKDQLGLETTLEEKPRSAHLPGPLWVICRDSGDTDRS